MRKLIIIFLLLALFVTGWILRYQLVFKFQYSRLKGLACQAGEADFINDSCLNKLWVHRVDSKERYGILKNKFAGYETDIVWDSWKRQFAVYHPPLEGKPIRLDRFLSAMDLKNAMLWLDTRETPVADTLNILKALDSLDHRFKIKMNVVIELYDTAVANYLADHEYWVALNIHPEWISAFKEPDWQTLKASMSPKISFISQEDIHVPFLKKQFPGKDIVTWSIAFSNYFNRAHLRQLVKDEQVKIVLVNIKSKYYK
jgi:hypothetical protein